MSYLLTGDAKTGKTQSGIRNHFTTFGDRCYANALFGATNAVKDMKLIEISIDERLNKFSSGKSLSGKLFRAETLKASGVIPLGVSKELTCSSLSYASNSLILKDEFENLVEKKVSNNDRLQVISLGNVEKLLNLRRTFDSTSLTADKIKVFFDSTYGLFNHAITVIVGNKAEETKLVRMAKDSEAILDSEYNDHRQSALEAFSDLGKDIPLWLFNEGGSLTPFQCDIYFSTLPQLPKEEEIYVVLKGGIPLHLLLPTGITVNGSQAYRAMFNAYESYVFEGFPYIAAGENGPALPLYISEHYEKLQEKLIRSFLDKKIERRVVNSFFRLSPTYEASHSSFSKEMLFQIPTLNLVLGATRCFVDSVINLTTQQVSGSSILKGGLSLGILSAFTEENGSHMIGIYGAMKTRLDGEQIPVASDPVYSSIGEVHLNGKAELKFNPNNKTYTLTVTTRSQMVGDRDQEFIVFNDKLVVGNSLVFNKETKLISEHNGMFSEVFKAGRVGNSSSKSRVNANQQTSKHFPNVGYTNT